MSDEEHKNVIDINQTLAARKAAQGLLFMCCPKCGNEEDENGDDSTSFIPVGYFKTNGDFVLTSLVCVSEICQGETEVEVKNGVIT